MADDDAQVWHDRVLRAAGGQPTESTSARLARVERSRDEYARAASDQLKLRLAAESALEDVERERDELLEAFRGGDVPPLADDDMSTAELLANHGSPHIPTVEWHPVRLLARLSVEQSARLDVERDRTRIWRENAACRAEIGRLRADNDRLIARLATLQNVAADLHETEKSMNMNGTYRDEAELRRDALSLAVDAFRENKQFAALRASDDRTKQIVAAATLFEAFLRGDTADGDPAPHRFVNDGAFACTICQDGASARWHLPEASGA